MTLPRLFCPVVSVFFFSVADAAVVYDFETGLGAIQDLSFSGGSNYGLATSADGTNGLSLFSHSANASTVVGLSNPLVCEDLNVGDTLSLSFDLVYTNSSNTNFLNWGFADLATGTSVSGFSSGSGGAFEFGIDGGSASFAAGTGSSTTGSSTFIPDGSYFVEFSVSSLGGDQFQVSSVLTDFATSAIVQSYSGSISIPGLEGQPVHPMFGQRSGRNTRGQSMVVDNIMTSVVPEPSGSLLKLGAAVLLLLLRRR